MPDVKREGVYDVYEVFIQRSPTEHHVHVGSVLAPSPELALQVARENFLRRDHAVSIWVVPREHVHATSYEDADFFARELDRRYREVAGYTENGRLWRMFKERMMTLEEVVQDLRGEADEGRTGRAGH
ncbi:MAG: phenylacetic acid degradation protein [Bacillota bacterium]|jgi:Uncharacterized enzyme of phenylacetate metabolism